MVVGVFFLEEMTNYCHLSSKLEIHSLFSSSLNRSNFIPFIIPVALLFVFLSVLQQSYWEGEIRIADNIQEVNTPWIYAVA